MLVTGGASGIGEAIAAAFLRQGARVAVLDRDPEALERSPAGRDGARGLLLAADVADPAAVEDAFSRIDKDWGGLDVLCNNAGISIRRRFLDTTLDDWNRTLAVNLTGAFLVAQHAARLMSRTGGVIVHTASVSGMVGMPHYAAYNVTKAGLIELTKTMALELAPRIRVNAVCPGYVLTPMQHAEYTDAMLRECASDIPLRRLGAPEEIAALVSYLASPEAAFVTGQSFVIDGGESAGGLASGA
ncbi:SDR family NAD(P)-dependent oxidoreductase [Streptomyces sp. NPDC003006]